MCCQHQLHVKRGQQKRHENLQGLEVLPSVIDIDDSAEPEGEGVATGLRNELQHKEQIELIASGH